MRHIKQLGIILFISFIGEILNTIIPLPIPASIYGLVLMFLCFKLKIIPPNAVKETGEFLIEIMPLMFIPAAVGLLESWNILQPEWLPVASITVVSTIAVMAVSGYVTQLVIRLENRRKANE
jgi:holin-like protein